MLYALGWGGVGIRQMKLGVPYKAEIFVTTPMGCIVCSSSLFHGVIICNFTNQCTISCRYTDIWEPLKIPSYYSIRHADQDRTYLNCIAIFQIVSVTDYFHTFMYKRFLRETKYIVCCNF